MVPSIWSSIAMLKEYCFYSPYTVPYIMADEVSIDIDDLDEFQRAEMVF